MKPNSLIGSKLDAQQRPIPAPSVDKRTNSLITLLWSQERIGTNYTMIVVDLNGDGRLDSAAQMRRWKKPISILFSVHGLLSCHLDLLLRRSNPRDGRAYSIGCRRLSTTEGL